jgi:hypothetical protein
MIDEDASSNSYHEHVQATSTLGNEETVEDIFFEPSLEDSLGERFDQIGYDLDLDKFLKQAMMFSEPSLEDPLEECFAQSECYLVLTSSLSKLRLLMSQVWRILWESVLLSLNSIWILK